jgi:hypothetical protein
MFTANIAKARKTYCTLQIVSQHDTLSLTNFHIILNKSSESNASLEIFARLTLLFSHIAVGR